MPLRLLAVTFDEFIDPAHVWRAPVSLEEYRASHDAAAAAQEAIDWRGFAPSDLVTSGPEADEESADQPAETAPTADAERARRVAAEEEAWHAHLREIVEGELVAHVRDVMASGRRFPTAAEYRTWSDERVAALRADGDPFEEALPTAADTAEDVGLDLHPLNRVMERVAVAQASLRQAEAVRVAAAATAWRAALDSVTGTVDAAVNGPFQRSVLMQLAFDLQVAEQTASALVHAALELEQRTPRSWAAFLAGRVPWRGMQMLHAAIDGLDEQFWDAFDEKAVVAVTTVAMPKLKPRLAEIRERVQAVTAVERHKKALQRMGVTIEPLADGMAAITAVLPAAEAVAIDLRLDLAARQAASAEGESRSIGQLRAHILMDLIDEGLFRGPRPDVEDDLAVPQRRAVQYRVGLLIPAMTATGHSDVPATLEGYGPIDIETAKALAGAATSWIKVLTDPITGAVLDIGRDKYRPTADMRALLGILDHAGRGPNTARPPSQCEADHVDPYRQGLARGRTALDNLVLLAVRDHRIKTSGYWDIELRALRDLAWTSFMGTRIITTVQPLEPTPIPDELRAPPSTPPDPAAWTDPDEADALDCPF